MKMPHRSGLPDGLITIWGKITLAQLDQETVKGLSEGKNPKKGLLIDFLGNFVRSAKEGLPIYRIENGPGFVWRASFDLNGRASFRFAAVDASEFSPPSRALVTAQLPSGSAEDAPVTMCDTYAASPRDPYRKTAGVPEEELEPSLAIPACASVVRTFPNSPRLKYQLGRGYWKSNNFGEAIIWFRQAAEYHYAPAEALLGYMFQFGQGVPQNYPEALFWYSKAADQGFKIVASLPEWAQTPIVLGESDPEGCAACSVKDNPQNSYRNGSLYASYTAESLYRIDALAKIEHINFLGAVNWSFEFEDQPYFAGFREMASNGLDKPVLNAFRMLGLLSNKRVKATSSNALPTNSVILDGVRGQPDINAIATRKDNQVAVLVWNYHDDDVPSVAAPIDLVIDGLPKNAAIALCEHFRIDSSHSNAFEIWKQMGSPQQPSDKQYQQLQDAGQLQLLNSPSWTPMERGVVRLQFALPRQGLSLLRITW